MYTEFLIYANFKNKIKALKNSVFLLFLSQASGLSVTVHSVTQ